MAGKSDIEAGRAFLKLFLKDDMTSALSRSLAKVGTKLQDTGRQVVGIGVKVLAAGSALAAPFIFSIKAASDFEENFSKFSVVFGERTKDVKAWGDAFAAEIQRAEGDVVKFLAANQDLFVPLGFDPAAAESLSKQVARLTFDLASFNNMADADVHRDLQAALTGSGEVMKKYGVIVSEAAVKQELLNQGLDPKVATNQQKVQSRLNIILAGTAAAQGDAARTAGSFANQMKGLQGVIKDLAVDVGNALLPMVTKIVTKFKEYVVFVRDFVKVNKAAVIAVASLAAGIVAAGVALIGIGGGLMVAGFAASTLASIIGILGAAISAIASPIGIAIAAILAAVIAWARFTESGRSAVAAASAYFGDLAKLVRETFGGIADTLMTGDIRGAAEIAFLGLQIAAMEGLAALRSLVGDTVTSIAGRLLSGDISGAWTDTLSQLSLLWAAFSEGVITTATGMANSIIQAWAKVTSFISRQILELASMPGFNQMFKFVSGVDVRAEVARGQQLGIADPLGNAQQIATQDIDQQASDIIGKLDAINAAARAVTDSAASDAVDATSSGIDALFTELEKKRSAFDAKRKAAAEKLGGEATAKGGASASTGSASAIDGGIGKGGRSPIVTFSAAAAVAAGYGGATPAQRLADEMEKTKKAAEETARTNAIIAAKITEGQASFAEFVFGFTYGS